MRTKIEARASERASKDMPFKSMWNLVQNQEQQNYYGFDFKENRNSRHPWLQLKKELKRLTCPSRGARKLRHSFNITGTWTVCESPWVQKYRNFWEGNKHRLLAQNDKELAAIIVFVTSCVKPLTKNCFKRAYFKMAAARPHSAQQVDPVERLKEEYKAWKHSHPKVLFLITIASKFLRRKSRRRSWKKASCLAIVQNFE